MCTLLRQQLNRVKLAFIEKQQWKQKSYLTMILDITTWSMIETSERHACSILSNIVQSLNSFNLVLDIKH
jgi:hypothetical protein